MANINHLFLRGAVWTWRRRLPSWAARLSPKIEHFQLSLRTKSLPDARILANRLTFEFDKMITAMQDGLTCEQGKAYLDRVIREETERISKRRLFSRMGGTQRDETSGVKQDWATELSWAMLSRDGLDAQITGKIAQDLKAAGAKDADLDILAETLYGLADELRSDTKTRALIRQAKDIVPNLMTEAAHSQAILQLKHLLVCGNALAWERTKVPKYQSEDQILAAVGLAPITEDVVGTPVPAQPTVQSPQVLEIDEKFKADPDIVAVTTRVNAAKNRKDLTPETQKQMLTTANLFVKITGITSICAVEQKHLKYFMNTLDEMPISYGKSAADPGRSIHEILERAKKLPPTSVGLSPRTQNGHLDRLQLLIRMAKSEGLPVSDIDFGLLRVTETERARDKRDAFRSDQISKIFQHPIWTGCANAKRRHTVGKSVIRDAQYWGPLLAAYTGARREELLGLAPADVREVDGIPCIDIRPNANRGVKTVASARIIPIHNHLIELGFLDYAATMLRTKRTALFPELIPTSETRSFGDNFHYNWSKALKQQLGHEAKDLCFHSWRHYVITTLKEEASVTDKQRRDLAGHVGEDVHDEVYDKATSPKIMQRVVNLLPRVF